jgi:hypothetical protein
MSVKSDSRSMTLKIFLDAKTFHCLKRSVPPGSNSKLVLNEKTVQLGNIRSSLFGSNVVISCNEVEARNLLLYTGHLPAVIASIHKALRSAGLSPDYPTHL